MQGKSAVKFQKKDEFHEELKKRIQAYFDEKGISSFGGLRIITKSGIIIGWIVLSYLWILLGTEHYGVWSAIAGAISLGMAMAALGFNVTHDANHGSYSERGWVNKMMGYTMDLIGGSSYVWRIKHNIIHHTYTNIAGIDDDINLWPWGRLAPDQPRLKVHRLQPFYIWPLYGLLSAKWQLDDILTAIHGRVNGEKYRRPSPLEMVWLIAGKLFYFSWMLVIPLFFFTWWKVLALCCLTSGVMGLVMSVTFQLAHCVEEADFFSAPADGKPSDFQSWARHQIETTINFAMRNPVLTWYMGGLNYQIEHHLFPRISHIHYPRIAPIVAQVSREFGVRYYAHRTFRRALFSHTRWLWRMGQPTTA